MIIWDINEGLAKPKKNLQISGKKFLRIKVDVSNLDEIKIAAQKRVRTEVGKVDILINNARNCCREIFS